MPSRPAVRRATLTLDRGTAEVTVDAEHETVAIVHRRRVAHLLPHEVLAPLGWGLVVASLPTAVVAAVLGGATVPLVLTMALVSAGLGLLLVSAHVDAFPPVRVLRQHDVIRIGGDQVELDDAIVTLRGRSWAVGHVDVSGAWGASGGTWLQTTLGRVRAGDFDAIELDDRIHARPRATALDPGRVTFELDHDALDATLEPPEQAHSDLGTALLAGLLSVAWLWWWTTRGSHFAIVAVYLVGGCVSHAWGVWLRHVARRRRHARIRLDARSLHFVEGGAGYRVPLVDVANVHLGPRAIQVDRRDGTAFLLGQGWPLPALERLTGELERALAAPESRDAARIPPVPAALARMVQMQTPPTG